MVKCRKIITTFIFSLIITVILSSCAGNDITPFNTDITIDLKHPFASRAILVINNGTETIEYEMIKNDSDKFSMYVDLTDDTNYLFNIKLVSDLFPGKALWVGKASGIDADLVSVLGNHLSTDYLVKTGVPVSTPEAPSAAFSFTKNTSGIHFGSGEKWGPDARIPAELPTYQKYCSHKLPPEGFTCALPWMHALHNGSENSESTVEVDFFRLYAHTSSGDVLLFSEDYSVDENYTGYHHGGLYLRHPFFYDEVSNCSPMPAEISNGNFIIKPSMHKDKVFHWWFSERVDIPSDAVYIFTEARIRITGDALIQIALDFWKDKTAPYSGLDVNNTEAGVSDCVFNQNSGEWQLVWFSTEHIIPWVD